MFIEFINLYGMKILFALALALFGWLGVVAKDLASKYINTDIKRSVARTAMAAVEQLYKDIHGPEKMQKALLIASGLLEEKGIKFTVDEMRMLIEAAVCEFNSNFIQLDTAEAVKLYDGPQCGVAAE